MYNLLVPMELGRVSTAAIVCNGSAAFASELYNWNYRFLGKIIAQKISH